MTNTDLSMRSIYDYARSKERTILVPRISQQPTSIGTREREHILVEFKLTNSRVGLIRHF